MGASALVLGETLPAWKLLAAALVLAGLAVNLFGARWRADGLKAMWLLLGEALLALAVLVFIVWWTMFSGRRKDDDPPP
jgi:MFS superfamily sulfate permease-like transporter